MYNQLGALSPLDGRYGNSVIELNAYFSEAALMRYRIYVEIEYLIALSKQRELDALPSLNEKQYIELRKIYKNFDLRCAKQIKEIESETNHDVKAIEYYIQKHCNSRLHPWIHFALTSEDVNNISYSLMWSHALEQIYVPTLTKLHGTLKKLAIKNKNLPMLSLTHGQPATTTTFGKELGVFCKRLERQVLQMKRHRLLGKLSGATGTWSAHITAYPNVNWPRFTTRFLKSLGLEPNLLTTQIEPHDSAAESYHHIVRVNSILKDLCQDMWFYISRGILNQKQIVGEVGSSTMPHKINPIQFENAEGNIGIANSLLNHLAQKLPVSRMQRDLSDSTVLRNQGVALGYSFLAIKNLQRGLSRITTNKSKMKQELNSHWEVIAEAIQTILRKEGKEGAYEKLKNLTQGETISEDSIKSFIHSLDITDSNKDILIKLSPGSYIGEANKLVGKV